MPGYVDADLAHKAITLAPGRFPQNSKTCPMNPNVHVDYLHFFPCIVFQAIMLCSAICPDFFWGTTNKHECVLPHVWVSGGDEEITFPIQTCTRAGDVRNAQWRAVRSIDDALQMT